jgi:hypothetical protein
MQCIGIVFIYEGIVFLAEEFPRQMAKQQTLTSLK